MPLLTDDESRRVQEAVVRAEKKSGGEIVTAIIPESEDYGFQELIFAVFVAVMAWTGAIGASSALGTVLDRLFWGWDAWMLSTIQGLIGMLAGLIAYLIAQVPVVDRLVVPRRVMREAVRRRALRHFVESGTHDTIENTGILIFVSLLERRVELIADSGIHKQVDAGRWDEIVAKLIEGIRAGRAGDALVEAVNACGEILDGTVERRVGDVNELPDRPDELERGS